MHNMVQARAHSDSRCDKTCTRLHRAVYSKAAGLHLLTVQPDLKEASACPTLACTSFLELRLDDRQVQTSCLGADRLVLVDVGLIAGQGRVLMLPLADCCGSCADFLQWQQAFLIAACTAASGKSACLHGPYFLLCTAAASPYCFKQL